MSNTQPTTIDLAHLSNVQGGKRPDPDVDRRASGGSESESPLQGIGIGLQAFGGRKPNKPSK